LFALANKQTCDFGLPKSVFHQNANAKSEFATCRANMSEAVAQRRLRAHSGFQGACPLARFLGSFFAAWQRMNIKTGTAHAQSCVRVRLYQFSKIQFPKG
jgi:hypothetical protein